MSIRASDLPGYNCGQCGYNTCEEYSKKPRKKDCVFLIENEKIPKETRSVIDNVKYDFKLEPLMGEPSCREFIMHFTMNKIKKDDLIRYRPLGCPIVHFASVLSVIGPILEIHIVGPKMKDKKNAIDLGLCMVLGFIGNVLGKIPSVGQTVIFLPSMCMMSHSHSGIVVSAEGKKIRIEGLDLKVWEHAQ